MNTRGFVVWCLCLFCLQISCNKKTASVKPQHIEDGLKSSEAPFSLSLETATFFRDIAYANVSERNTYDFFKPNQEAPSSLVIMIHGGGFVAGDKNNYYDSYKYRQLINYLLEQNIAVATINYRFIDPLAHSGILYSLEDVKLVLQHLRYFSNVFHFDTEKVLLYGGSAGGAAAMWIGFQEDMADKTSNDPIKKESTRVQGIVALNVQANYDIVKWHTTVFSDFKKAEFDATSIQQIVKKHRLLATYGIEKIEELDAPKTQAYIQKTNMLEMLSANAPEFYLQTEDFENEIPTTLSELYHHPQHVNTIYKKAENVGAKGIYNCPAIHLNPINDESIEEFIIRKIGRQVK